MRRVAKQRPVQVVWRLFSLAKINENNEMDEARRLSQATGRKMERLLIAARRRGGNEALERLYVAMGDALHGRREDLGDDAVVSRCLEQAGLPGGLYSEALADESTERDL